MTLKKKRFGCEFDQYCVELMYRWEVSYFLLHVTDMNSTEIKEKIRHLL